MRLCPQEEEAPVLRMCFKGVQRDGEHIQVRDTVLLKSGPRKKSLPYVAKISALWEEPETGRDPHGFCQENTKVTDENLTLKPVLSPHPPLSHRRADDELVLVLPSRAHTGRTEPQCSFRSKEANFLFIELLVSLPLFTCASFSNLI